MKISKIYRISSRKKLVSIDDVSITPDMACNKIIIVEKQLPENETALIKSITDSSLSMIIVVDNFKKTKIETFDYIVTEDNRLIAIEIFEINKKEAIICIPECYISLNTNQELDFIPKTFKAEIVTLSDSAHLDIEEDKRGQKAVSMITSFFEGFHKRTTVKHTIIPKRKTELEFYIEQAKHDKIDILITVGGTGMRINDFTVETIRHNLDKEIPGIMEIIRVKYGAENPKALLKDGVAGIMNSTLVFTLPGNERAVEDYLTEIFKCLKHMLYMKHGIDSY